MAKIILDIKQDKKETFIKMINSIIVDRNCEIKLFQAPSKIEHHDEIHVLLKAVSYTHLTLPTKRIV